jgi:maltose alpha-D-glucosyltransferase/alpha-amylase
MDTCWEIAVAAGWETALDGRARAELERSALPAFLRAQRWFGGKSRRIEGVRLADWGDFPAGAARTFLALLEVGFAGGGRDLYFLPLGITTGPEAEALLQSLKPWVIARLTGPDGEAVLHDALADDAACTALMDAIGAGREFATRGGRVRAAATAAFARLRGDSAAMLPVARGPATSSNSLIFYGRRLLLKLFRRLEEGVNPDVEIGRFLTETSPFPRTPQVAGTLEYHRPGAEPMTLALLQQLVPNQGDGWSHALAELADHFERAAGSGHGSDLVAGDRRPLLQLAQLLPPAAVREAIGAYLDAAATLGRRTGEMHLALAADPHDPAFAPESFTAADAAALHAAIAAGARQALAALREHVGQLPESVAAAARRLLERGPALPDRTGDRRTEAEGGQKIRCHGDYHLGQVLWLDNDFVILDFEGEPTRTVAERRAKQSPLKDVAGMLRSFHYAAYAGLFAFAQDRPQDVERHRARAETWFRWASAAFLRAYRAAVGQAAFLPHGSDGFSALLDSFMLDKACYELEYELNNRPDWVRIPLSGILALTDR